MSACWDTSLKVSAKRIHEIDVIYTNFPVKGTPDYNFLPKHGIKDLLSVLIFL